MLLGSIRAPSMDGAAAAFDPIVLRGLSHDPGARFTSAREMATALGDCAPPATPADVAQWVEHLSGGTLRERTAIVRAVEEETGTPPGPPRRRGRGGRARAIAAGVGAGRAVSGSAFARSRVRVPAVTAAAREQPPAATSASEPVAPLDLAPLDPAPPVAAPPR